MKIKNHIIEVYENNTCIAKLKDLGDWEDFLYNYVHEHDYKIKFQQNGGDDSIYLLVNWKKRHTTILSYKSYIGYKDKNGKKLYYGDTIRDVNGNTSSIYQHYDTDQYYFRIHNKNNFPLSWTDYDIENFKEFEKVSDVLDKIFNDLNNRS